MLLKTIKDNKTTTWTRKELKKGTARVFVYCENGHDLTLMVKVKSTPRSSEPKKS